MSGYGYHDSTSPDGNQPDQPQEDMPELFQEAQGLPGLYDTVRLAQELLGKRTIDRPTDDIDYSGWATPIDSHSESAGILAKVKEVLNLKKELAQIDNPNSNSSDSLESASEPQALEDKEFAATVAEINKATGFMESLTKSDAFWKVAYAVLDTIDGNALMQEVRALWAKVPPKLQAAIAASPTTANMVHPVLGGIAHYMVKAGLLPHAEKTIMKGEEIQEQIIDLGKWAALFLKELKVLTFLVKPLLEVLKLQNGAFAKMRAHLAERHAGLYN